MRLAEKAERNVCCPEEHVEFIDITDVFRWTGMGTRHFFVVLVGVIVAVSGIGGGGWLILERLTVTSKEVSAQP